MNTLMIVGRLAKDVEIKKLDSGKEVTKICVAVNRSFKSVDGTYGTDFIDCTLWDEVAINVGEYCHKGDLVGIRGRLQTSFYEKDKVNHKVLDVIAEKVSFISSRRPQEEA